MKNHHLKKFDTGIYGIKIQEEIVYIGHSSVSFNKRFKGHISQLKRGKGVNKLMQIYYDQFGSSQFSLEILELIRRNQMKWILFKNILLEREIYWITKMQPRMNTKTPKLIRTDMQEQMPEHFAEQEDINAFLEWSQTTQPEEQHALEQYIKKEKK